MPANHSIDYKEYRRRWDTYPEYDLLNDFPIHLDVETQTICNLSCSMCYQSFDRVKQQRMSDDMFLKIMKESEEYGLCSVKLQLRNEPLMDSRLIEFIKIAKRSGIVDVMINTNATLLTRDISQQLIDSGLDTIICSVDGYTKKAYESIRIGAKFDKVLKNIKTLSKLKKLSGSSTPRIILRTIEMNDIDINEYKDFWKPYADTVVSYPMMDVKQMEDYTVYPKFCCKELWRRLSILADGTIVPCCSAAVGNKVYNPLGNVNTLSIHDAWRKVEYARDIHRLGKSHTLEMCRHCDSRDKYI